MGYHDSFWVVVGGAAPVIALAAVLAAKDTGAQLWQWRQSTFVDVVRGKRAMFSPTTPEDNRFIGLIWVGLLLFFVNIVMQAVALGFSLLSLAYGKNEISPTFGVIAGIGGLTILALATFSSHRASMIEMRDRSTGSLPLEELKRFAADFYGKQHYREGQAGRDAPQVPQEESHVVTWNVDVRGQGDVDA